MIQRLGEGAKPPKTPPQTSPMTVMLVVVSRSLHESTARRGCAETSVYWRYSKVLGDQSSTGAAPMIRWHSTACNVQRLLRFTCVTIANVTL